MLHNPALTLSLALAAGLLVQVLATHLRLPGIVLLLAAGVLLGPDGAALIQPDSLGQALPALIGFAVAIILFEGGMNLNLKRLRRESGVIQRLITLGAIVTAGCAAICARLILDWDWRLAILFGTLVIVTGPTVIQPLLKRIKIKRKLQTILEAEGVLIDPVGAILAVVVLDIIVSGGDASLAQGLLGLAARLGGGFLAGAIGGLLISLLLKSRRLVPEGLENVLTLALVLALYHLSESIQHESGIAAVTAAGMVVGNLRPRKFSELMAFKEQLTVMFIGLLFVLLAADVRLSEVQQLGWRGLVVAALIIFAVRPINIAVCTISSGLTVREKLFLNGMAPRGIIAAAVASLFAIALENNNIGYGLELRGMVFLVIVSTVLIQGLAAGPLASMLGVRRQTGKGFAILGANTLSLAFGRALREAGEEILFLDSRADLSNAAQKEGFRVIYGNVLEESVLQRAGLEDLAAVIALTPNEEINYLFAKRAQDEFKVKTIYVALHHYEGQVSEEMLEKMEAKLLFGRQVDIDLWILRLRRKTGIIEWWQLQDSQAEQMDWANSVPDDLRSILLPLSLRREKKIEPIDNKTSIKKGDSISFLILQEKRDAVVGWLVERGWVQQTCETNASKDKPPKRGQSESREQTKAGE